MGFPVINPMLQFLDNSGNVLAGGKVFTYAPNSSTPKTTYSNAELSTPNANPVVLDSAGRCAIYVANGETYKYILTDSAGDTGSPIDTQDNVKSPADLDQAGVGALLYPRTAGEIAAGVTPTSYAYPPLNVLRYGADRTGVANSSTAIQTAVKVAMNSKEATGACPVEVFFPDGEYLMTSGVAIATGVVLRCSAPWSATLTCTATTAAIYTSTFAAGTFTDNLSATVGQVQAGTHSASNCGLINLFIDHTGAMTGSAPSGATWSAVVQMVGAPDSVIDNVAISGTTNNKNGASLKFCWRTQITKPTIARSGGSSGGTALLLDSQCNAARVSGPFIQGNFAIGIDIAGCNSVTVIEPSVELGNDIGVRLGGVAPRLIGGYYEGNGTDIVLGATGSPVNRALVMMGWHNGSSSQIAINIVSSIDSRIVDPYVTGTYSTSIFESTSSATENYGNIIEYHVGDANDSSAIATLGLDGGRNLIRFFGENFDDHRFFREYKSSDSLPAEQSLNQRGAGFICFQVHLVNTGGTLQVMVTDGDDAAPDYDGCFVATSATVVNLPDVASGAGFGSAPAGRLTGTNSVIVLNTGANTVTEQSAIVGNVRTNGGTACAVQLRYQSRNINGTTRVRPELILRDTTSDATFDFDTTNFTNGQYIKIPVIGFVV